MRDFESIRIPRGADFSKKIYLGTYREIEYSTNANPSVITVTNHGYSTSEKKQIKDHVGNEAINNTIATPLHTITAIDAHTFSVPIPANGAGTRSGTVLTPRNLTGETVYCQFRNIPSRDLAPDSTSILFSPTIAITTATEGLVTLSISRANTFKTVLTLDKYWCDILIKKADNTYEWADDEPFLVYVGTSVTRV